VYTFLALTTPRPLVSRRILIVDDQPSMRGVLQVALEEAGADVWAAGDGPSALVILESALPDLILLDLVMPRMDGWEVLKRLKASPRTAKLPVVLETSVQDYASFASARREGVAAFLSKPFRLGELVETCRRILDGARPLQGKLEAETAAPQVQLRDDAGNLIGVGRLLDLAPSGAQVDLDRPLAPAQTVALILPEGGATRDLRGEVRWVRKVGERFHHGFALRLE
jgi:CheY-like chemotaxis protein